MANQLRMADVQAIVALHKRGRRNRRIARELEIDCSGSSVPRIGGRS